MLDILRFVFVPLLKQHNFDINTALCTQCLSVTSMFIIIISIAHWGIENMIFITFSNFKLIFVGTVLTTLKSVVYIRKKEFFVFMGSANSLNNIVLFQKYSCIDKNFNEKWARYQSKIDLQQRLCCNTCYYTNAGWFKSNLYDIFEIIGHVIYYAQIIVLGWKRYWKQRKSKDMTAM